MNVAALRCMSNEQKAVVAAHHKTQLTAGLAQVNVLASNADLENANSCGLALRIG
jgi:hypothetical protein